MTPEAHKPDAAVTGALPDAAATVPDIVGDVVFGSMASPVAVCTLASRTLLPALAGRAEIAVAGRVFTENVGVERMVQNLAAFDGVRFLIVCGRETRHMVGQTILALHKSGLDEHARVVGSEAPEPVMPNLTAEQVRAYQQRIAVVDLIGESDPEVIIARARALADESTADRRSAISPEDAATAGVRVERIAATRDPIDAWVYDPVGYFLVFVDRPHGLLRVEQYSRTHALQRIIEGRRAEEICHTILRLGQATLLAHAAYLGRELAKAEVALHLGLDYEQDRPVTGSSVTSSSAPSSSVPNAAS